MDPPNPVALLGITRESGEANRTESRRGEGEPAYPELSGKEPASSSTPATGGGEWRRLRETLAPGSVGEGWRRLATMGAGGGGLAGVDPGSGGGKGDETLIASAGERHGRGCGVLRAGTGRGMKRDSHRAREAACSADSLLTYACLFRTVPSLTQTKSDGMFSRGKKQKKAGM
jgi:hypothetical protein